jgi:hypothetical protein
LKDDAARTGKSSEDVIVASKIWDNYRIGILLADAFSSVI